MVELWVARVALLAAVGLPLVAGAAGWRRWRQGCLGLSWLGATFAIVALVAIALRGPLASGASWAGCSANPVSVVLVALVVGVGALVQSFSDRYLQADLGKGRFSGRVGVVVSAMALVAASASLWLLLAGWVVAGTGFVAVVGYRSDLPGVAALRRSMRRSLVVGDLCLVIAVAVIWWRVGDLSLSPPSLLGGTHQLGALHDLVASLIVIAALSRCAQAMFHRWLRLTVCSPTPACALLHAGVVNGGGVLLVRLGPLGAWGPAMAILFALSGASSVMAALVMAAQPDVKGQLAYSTMSQMGFMLSECAVGAYGAAIVHLVGHGAYKASLFFGSGSAVSRPGGVATRRLGRRARLSAGALGALAATAAAAPGVAHGEAPVLCLFVAATTFSLAAGSALTHRESRPGVPVVLGGLLVIIILAGLYGGLVALFGNFLAPALPHATAVLDPWWLAALGVGGLLAIVATRTRRFGPSIRAWALDAAAPVGWDGEVAQRLSMQRT